MTMVRGLLIPMSPTEEIALRQVANGALAVSPKLVSRLQQLGLVERATGGWRLTPLGNRRLSELPGPQLRKRAPDSIEGILDRYIPLAKARGIGLSDQAEEDSSQATPDDHAEPRRLQRILVAEDSYIEADAIARLLGESGFEVVGPVARVDQAMSLASAESLDAALLDIDLDGERSFAVASALRQRNVPVAFVSGHHASIVPALAELRAIPFVAKPFENGELVNVVETLATRHAG